MEPAPLMCRVEDDIVVAATYILAPARNHPRAGPESRCLVFDEFGQAALLR
jgi:hypothetical protein